MVQTTFVATSGDRTVLSCPLQPGALLKYYSVLWMKDNIGIAEIRNPHNIVMMTDSRYSINATSYSLIIDDTNENDSSINYQCALFVTNPLTDVRQELKFSTEHDVLLSLQVLSKSNTICS